MIALAVLFLLWMGNTQEQGAPSTTRTEFVAKESFSISGTVVDAISGQPLAAAQVRINGPDAQLTVTGEDGRFTFGGLEAGKYPLSARRKGYPESFYKQHEQFSTAIVTGPGLNTENLRFALRPGAAITGVVTDEAGEPVRDARVILFQKAMATGRRATFEQGETQTNDLGQYRFGQIEPGTYFVTVSAQPWYAQRGQYWSRKRTLGGTEQRESGVTRPEPEMDVVYRTTFFPNAIDLDGAAPIALHSGAEEQADVRLQAAPALRLIVHTAPPAEGSNSNVWARASQQVAEGSDIDLNFHVSSQQIAPGVLEISGLPPGRINLDIGSNANGESSSRQQTVQLSQNAEINLEGASSYSSVSGVARLEDGSTIAPPPFIQLRSTNGRRVYPMRPDQTGAFAVKNEQVAPGTYEVWVGRQSPPALIVKTMTATNAKVLTARSLEVGSGQDVKLNLVLATGEGQIGGLALKDGKPVDGVMLVLVPEVPEHNLVLFRRDQSDSDGSFNLNGVIAGKYTVVAIENGWDLEWFAPEVLKKYLAGGERVEVAPGATLEVKVKVQ
jgi:hypothetical protein